MTPAPQKGLSATMRSVNGPITFSGVAPPTGAWVPGLGEHNDEVLRGLTEELRP